MTRLARLTLLRKNIDQISSALVQEKTLSDFDEVFTLLLPVRIMIASLFKLVANLK